MSQWIFGRSRGPHDPNSSTEPLTSPTRAASTSLLEPKDDHCPAAWGVGWQCPALMVGLYLFGVLMFVAHHLYYDSLDNTLVQSADQQTWAIRIGTGLAFLVKTFFVAAIGVAATQLTWVTLRRKSVKLRGIDAMFNIFNNPIAFFVPDMWICAKTLTLLAAISWLIPLTALITPATLSVHLRTVPNVTQIRVPTVNFSENFFWEPWALFEGRGLIEKPSSAISRFFTVVSSSVSTTTLAPTFANSSYTLEFWGPSYRCQNLTEFLPETEGITYKDGLNNKNYSSFQGLWDDVVLNSTSSKTLEPMYVGSAPTFLNNTLLIYATGRNPLWDNSTGPASLVCQLWNTSYVLGVHYTDGVQNLVPISTDFEAPSNWNSWAGTNLLFDDYGPEVNGGYYITHLLFSSLIEGSLTIGSTGSLIGDGTPLMQSGLFDCPELWNGTYGTIINKGEDDSTGNCRNKTLARAVEDLSRNFTLSLLSLNTTNTSVPVTVSSPRNFYTYDRRNLFAAYVTALAVTVVCITIGLFALWNNGVSQDTSFSSVLRTTRNPELDSLATGYCFPSDQLPNELGKVRLRYGEVETAQPLRHAAFGFEASVKDLVKGEKYY